MTRNGIRIINASFFSGLMFEGPGDGTSPYSNSLYALWTRPSPGRPVGERGPAMPAILVDRPLDRCGQRRLARLRAGVDMNGMTLAAART